MKRMTLLFVVFFNVQYLTFIQAQNIPNGDFEEWLTCLCDPPYWYTNNIYPPPLECLQISQGFLPYSGDFSIEGVVDSCVELSVIYPPILTSFDINLNVKPEALHGFYKYFPIGGDFFSAKVEVFANNILIGVGSLESEQEVTDFTEFIVDIEYTTGDNPDKAVIEFTIDSSQIDNQLHQGSLWYVDYLRFDTLSAVNNQFDPKPHNFYLFQNYPNPFNPITTIKYQIPELSFVTLKVFDVLGNEIETLVREEKTFGNYEISWNAENLPSGVYFCRLKAGDFISEKKMIVIK
jgi:hypothetical protein